MRVVPRFLLTLLILAHWASPATAELYRVETRAGQVHVGAVELLDGSLKVAPPGGDVVSVPAGNLRTLRRLGDREAAAALRSLSPSTTLPSRGLRAEYFAGTNLGDVAFERTDPTPNFEGRGGEPRALDISGLPSAFSVRWTGQITPPATGDFKFFVSSDDASRVWVDGATVAEKWGAVVMSDVQAVVPLVAGKPAPITIEYMDIGGGQFFRLEWEGPGTPRAPVPPEVFTPASPTPPAPWPGPQRRGGLRAQYFSDKQFKSPAAITTETSLDFEWNQRRPVPGVEHFDKPFSLVLTATLFPEVSGTHRFYVEADDRARIHIGDAKVSDTFENRRGSDEFDVELHRDRPVPVRIEFANEHDRGRLRFRIRRPGSGDVLPLSAALFGLPDGDDQAPLVRIDRQTLPTRFFSSEIGDKVALARAYSPSGRLAKLEWLAGEQVLASSPGTDGGTLTLPLAKLPLGRTELRFRATDSAGRTSVSDIATIEAEGIPAGVVSGPWRDVRVGNAEARAEIRQDADAGTGAVLLRAAPGDIDLNDDSVRLLGQPVGDNAFVQVRFTSVSSEPAGGFALGGLMLRRNLDPPSESVAVILDADGNGRVVSRRLGWNPAVSTPITLAPGTFVRLAREPDGVRVSTRASPDGPWKSVWFSDVRLQGEAWAGAMALSRVGTAAFRFSDLSTGTSEPPASDGRGVMLTSGTYIAGDARIDPDGKIFVWHRDRVVEVDPARVAYFAFGTVARSQLAALSARAPCALMRGDDITGGELVQLRDGKLSIDSDLFGRITTDTWSGEIRAVALRKFRVTPPDAGAVLRLRDGSLLRSESVRVTPEGLFLEGPSIPAGATKVTLPEISTRAP